MFAAQGDAGVESVAEEWGVSYWCDSEADGIGS